jgi:hypothetical protein
MDSKINNNKKKALKQNMRKEKKKQKRGILEYLFFSFLFFFLFTNLRTLDLVKVTNATDQRGTSKVGTKRVVNF